MTVEELNIENIKSYWMIEADEALNVTDHLFEKKDYSYALFFGHLAVEKILKAFYVDNKKRTRSTNSQFAANSQSIWDFFR